MFTVDLPRLESDVYALSQRPIAAAAFEERNGPAAWKNLPSWAAVGTADCAAGSDVVRQMAQRANAKITEIDGSHVIMISQPDAVTEVILEALKAVSQQHPRRGLLHSASRTAGGPLRGACRSRQAPGQKVRGKP